MKLKPIGNNVIIKEHKAEDVTKSGIIIPEQAQSKSQKGVVVSASKDSQVKAGDEVVFGKYSGSEIEVDSIKLLIVKEEDIFAILK